MLESKIQRLAGMIRKSKNFMAFTGAGISTAAGIPDFRSGMNTVLKTGPGVWELRAKVHNNPTTCLCCKYAKFAHLTE